MGWVYLLSVVYVRKKIICMLHGFATLCCIQMYAALKPTLPNCVKTIIPLGANLSN
jgi:hypothetical protein